MDSDQNIPPDKFEPLFKLTKEILKYKGVQVENLLADLDVLATNAGSGEVQSEKHTEALVVELQAKERELIEEKALVEKLQNEVAESQREKNELRREIILIQNENQAGLSASFNEDNTEDVAHLKDTIQHKNKHILQLLSDIEVLEKENDTLNKKVNMIRRELSEATTNLTKLSGENISLRQASYDYKEQISALEERNAALTTQVSELVNERARRDANLDELIDALEERVAKWQEIFSYKEKEIEELKAQLLEISQSSQAKQTTLVSANYTALIKTIEEQEDIIEQLRGQLKQAGDDLTKSTAVLQEFKKKSDAKENEDETSSKVEELREELHKAQQQITYLQEKVNEAEQDAQFRAEEMTELIIQLKEYEDGVYGLAEARREIKETKKQLSIRDKQILNLVQELNDLHMKAGDNIQIDGEKILSNVDDEDKISELDLKLQLNQVQQTAIHLSMQNFDLKAQIKILSDELNSGKPKKTITSESENQKAVVAKDESELTEMEEKIKLLIDENEGLRKGLHEIMESIRTQDGSSNVVIESESLERVIEALDSRHVSGWYHPAMRLQAALNKMQGINDALRQQLHESRYRESYFQAELQTSYIRIGELENELSKSSSNHKQPVPAPRKIKDVTDAEDRLDGNDEGVQEELENVEENAEIETEKEDHSEDKEPKKAVEMSPSHQEQIDRREEGTVTEIVNLETSATQTEVKPSSGGSVRSANGSVKSAGSAKGNGSRKSSANGLRQRQPDENAQQKTEKDVAIEEPENNGKMDDNTYTINGSKSQSEKDKNSYDDKDIDTSEEGNSLKTKFIRIEENEIDLREKCEQLRRDLENIKTSTEQALLELKNNKDALFEEFHNAMKKVNEQLDRMKETSTGQQPPVQITNLESAAATFQTQESKLFSYGLELVEQKKLIAEKDALIMQLEERVSALQAKLDATVAENRESNDKRVISLKETVTNFRNIIKQKEGVIEKYKTLLEKCTEECSRLTDRNNELEERLAKLPKKESITDSKAVTVLMEKWLIRVHNLEDEIRDLTFRLNEANCALAESKKEVDNWKNIATSNMEKVDEKDDNEIYRKNQEIEELKMSINEMKANAEMTYKNKLRNENIKFKKKEDELNKKIKAFEIEISKLKHISSIKSSKTTNKAVKREFMLLDRIKQLEEELESCKNREKNTMQMRKDRCAEEVTKWEEKKKLQTINEKYKSELKEKSLQMEMYETQITRLKSIISKMEKERIALQRRLKMSEDLLAKSMAGLTSKNDDFIEKEMALDEDRLIGTPKYTPRSHSDSPSNDEKLNLQSRADLIKAVAALRKVISKLRQENSNFVHKDYVKKLQTELHKMEENYMDAVERNLALEEQLREADAKLSNNADLGDSSVDRNAFQFLKEQLDQKCELLSKVKVLLQRAILREKQLIQQVTLLKTLVPPEKMEYFHKEAREP
ncbi:hypothetical protein O3M35_008993 [Rhynocoris fuscipes]|uniref:Uncharacterized protein n=1 Tax=Rhynocoris fuscipes TaxID=488301 RepID=A0AAW1D8Z0_9HEMI